MSAHADWPDDVLYMTDPYDVWVGDSPTSLAVNSAFPTGVLAEAAGVLYSLDVGNQEIEVRDPITGAATALCSFGGGAPTFKHISGLNVDILDSNEDVLFEAGTLFGTAGGQHVYQLDTSTSTCGYTSALDLGSGETIYDVAFAPDGRMFAWTTRNPTEQLDIEVVDLSGQISPSFLSVGPVAGSSASIAFSSAGSLWTHADLTANTLQQVDLTDGSILDEVEVNAGAGLNLLFLEDTDPANGYPDIAESHSDGLHFEWPACDTGVLWDLAPRFTHADGDPNKAEAVTILPTETPFVAGAGGTRGLPYPGAGPWAYGWHIMDVTDYLPHEWTGSEWVPVWGVDDRLAIQRALDAAVAERAAYPGRSVRVLLPHNPDADPGEPDYVLDAVDCLNASGTYKWDVDGTWEDFYPCTTSEDVSFYEGAPYGALLTTTGLTKFEVTGVANNATVVEGEGFDYTVVQIEPTLDYDLLYGWRIEDGRDFRLTRFVFDGGRDGQDRITDTVPFPGKNGAGRDNIRIYSPRRFELLDFQSNNSPGSGLTIDVLGEALTSEDLGEANDRNNNDPSIYIDAHILNSRFVGNAYLGVSVSAGRRIHIEQSHLSFTNGISTMAGLSLERSDASAIAAEPAVSDVLVHQNQFAGNWKGVHINGRWDFGNIFVMANAFYGDSGYPDDDELQQLSAQPLTQTAMTCATMEDRCSVQPVTGCSQATKACVPVSPAECVDPQDPQDPCYGVTFDTSELFYTDGQCCLERMAVFDANTGLWPAHGPNGGWSRAIASGAQRQTFRGNTFVGYTSDTDALLSDGVISILSTEGCNLIAGNEFYDLEREHTFLLRGPDGTPEDLLPTWYQYNLAMAGIKVSRTGPDTYVGNNTWFMNGGQTVETSGDDCFTYFPPPPSGYSSVGEWNNVADDGTTSVNTGDCEAP